MKQPTPFDRFISGPFGFFCVGITLALVLVLIGSLLRRTHEPENISGVKHGAKPAELECDCSAQPIDGHKQAARRDQAPFDAVVIEQPALRRPDPDAVKDHE